MTLKKTLSSLWKPISESCNYFPAGIYPYCSTVSRLVFPLPDTQPDGLARRLNTEKHRRVNKMKRLGLSARSHPSKGSFSLIITFCLYCIKPSKCDSTLHFIIRTIKSGQTKEKERIKSTFHVT